MKTFILLLVAILSPLSLFPKNAFCQKDSLRSAIERISLSSKGKVGVAIMGLEDRDTLSILGRSHFPMQSVFKFPLAIFVLHLIDSGQLSLALKIHISKKELPEDTWSPLRDKYPHGNVDLSIRELLEYSVSKSDNNATDILFGVVGGPKKVRQYLHSIGIQGIAVAKTEQQMHDSWNAQFQNWCEPLAMVHLLDAFYRSNFLSFESTDLLMNLMTASENSPKRIRGLLPAEAVVAHKTGTSNTNNAGVNAATNDVGIVTLPNGTHFAIVIYVSMSTLDLGSREKIIAQIAKAAWDHFSAKEYPSNFVRSIIRVEEKR